MQGTFGKCRSWHTHEQDAVPCSMVQEHPRKSQKKEAAALEKEVCPKLSLLVQRPWWDTRLPKPMLLQQPFVAPHSVREVRGARERRKGERRMQGREGGKENCKREDSRNLGCSPSTLQAERWDPPGERTPPTADRGGRWQELIVGESPQQQRLGRDSTRGCLKSLESLEDETKQCPSAQESG